MNSSNLLYDPGVDDVFGPQVHGVRAGFDFTLLFEQSIMSIGPSALLLIMFPLRAVQLYRQGVKVKPGKQLRLKLVWQPLSCRFTISLPVNG
jgi:ATP-binding cassette, subfamily C (CFTR/MRP), member 1